MGDGVAELGDFDVDGGEGEFFDSIGKDGGGDGVGVVCHFWLSGG